VNVKDQLHTLAQHLDTTRQAGHSTAVLRALDPALAERHAGGKLEERHTRILCYDMRSADALNIADRNTVTLQSLDRLRGQNGPLLFDNGALWDLFSRAHRRIDELESSLSAAEDKLRRIAAALL
jgi:hypothetical protein